MLLANMAVAHQIYRSFPEQALLRRHPPPQTKLLKDLMEFCNQVGLDIDFSTAGTLHVSALAWWGLQGQRGGGCVTMCLQRVVYPLPCRSLLPLEAAVRGAPRGHRPSSPGSAGGRALLLGEGEEGGQECQGQAGLSGQKAPVQSPQAPPSSAG